MYFISSSNYINSSNKLSGVRLYRQRSDLDNHQEIKRIENSDVLFTTLTECLNHIYLKYEVSEFRIDRKKGVIYIDDGVEVEPVIETYSLYGER